MALRAIAPPRRPPAKRRDGLTPADAAKRDAVARARPPAAAYDAEVYARAADLARVHGLDPSRVFDEIEDRADARRLTDNVSAADAARLAFLDVLGRYEH